MRETLNLEVYPETKLWRFIKVVAKSENQGQAQLKLKLNLKLKHKGVPKHSKVNSLTLEFSICWSFSPLLLVENNVIVKIRLKPIQKSKFLKSFWYIFWQ